MEAAVRRAHAVTAFVLALVLPLAGCGDDGDDDDGGGSAASEEEQERPSGPTTEVIARDFSFDPTDVPVEAGREVTILLTNEGSAEHNITIEDLDVDEDAEGGETAQATVTADAGSYDFRCKYHPDQMQGTVTAE
jgi:plastocyanin